jgi:dienelactone hydrolase
MKKRDISFADVRDYLAGRFPRLTDWSRRAWAWIARFACTHKPGPRAWRGAAFGLALGTFIVVADALIHDVFLPLPTWWGAWGATKMIAGALAAGIGIVIAAALLTKTPWRFRFALVISVIILSELFPFRGDWRVLVGSLLAFAFAGAGLASINRRGFREVNTRVQRWVAIGGLVAGLASVVALLLWLSTDGYELPEYHNAAVEAEAGIPMLQLPDPSLPGDFTVLTLTYGSGTDIRRPEFGSEADLITETVDGRPMLQPWDNDDRGRERKAFWGFDRDELPLQARVWYPEGAGPFPLVLIVHGNHGMREYSDPGYEYLGELLASRGFILASIDENFINGAIRQENDARGWLLLEHLKVWEQWNEDPDNLFYGRVDMSRIGLIGHSRGGEAVAVAAAFNDLPYYPDDATVEFDYGFDIGAVIAIAPIMGQYRPGGRYTEPHDVNYFVFHGANDMDVSSFASGSGQYEKVTFSGDEYRFKSALYVMAANHGQWNTVWGRYDAGKPYARMMNVHPLMSGEDQRQIGKVYISAFLEATLRGESGYVPLFADARVGADWLPDTAYLIKFDDSRSTKVATFEEDVDVTTTTMAGGRTWGENLTVWREDMVEMKWGPMETAAVYVGWMNEEECGGDDCEDEDDDAESDDSEGSNNDDNDDNEEHDAGIPGGTIQAEGIEAEDVSPSDEAQDLEEAEGARVPARYVVELPESLVIDPAATLFFSMADADESPEPRNRDDEDEENGDDNEEGHDTGEQNEAEHGDQSEHGQESEHAGQTGHDSDNEDDNDDNESNNNDEKEQEDEDEDAPREPIDLTVRLIDAAGEVAELPLSRFSFLQPQLEVELNKAIFDDPDRESEPVFQSFAFPLAWFAEANPAFDPSEILRLEFVFDRTEKGVVIIDSIGFRAPAGGG